MDLILTFVNTFVATLKAKSEEFEFYTVKKECTNKTYLPQLVAGSAIFLKQSIEIDSL